VVEPDGAVLVSSNIVPDLWRVDAAAPAVTRLRFTLEQDATRDFGFASLRFTAEGALHAVGSIDGGAWRIDMGASRARRHFAHPEVARSAR